MLKNTLSPPPLPISLVSAPAGTFIYGSLDNTNPSLSSINLAKSTVHLPMRSAPEDFDIRSISGKTDMSKGDVEDEMNEICRRREEVGLRYEARLGYLQAKLKGAQLHEKLMKK